MITRSLIRTTSLIMMLLLPLQALASGLLACEQHQDPAMSQSHEASAHASHHAPAASVTPECHGQPVSVTTANDEPASQPGLELECRHCINSCQTKPGFDRSGAGGLVTYTSDDKRTTSVSMTLPGFTQLPQRPPCH